ncbi:MAG TPA: ribonuclease III [Vicinamibacterales bacterium]|nr:ribonuclease III [Vicinamibacterales bacterium]
MEGPTVVFRTSSEIEASVVRGLLEAHGIPSVVLSGLARTVFPLTGSGELRVAVSPDRADAARQLIESHRREVPAGRVVPLRDEFSGLERAIGYRFRNPALLEHALTHRSHVHEDATGGVIDNESLEFLGDAVLGFLVAELLFREFPDRDEGWKSKVKAWLVSEASLARLGTALDLGSHLILGRGEEKSGGRRKRALVADSFEALLAALYLDGGLDAARAFVERQYRDLIDEARRAASGLPFTADYKSTLQERLQALGRGLPAYRLVAETGPAHRRRFEVEVWVDERAVARGEGGSKKAAEQEAARRALEALGL